MINTKLKTNILSMEIGQLVVWKTQVFVWKDDEQISYARKQYVGMLTDIFRLDADDSDLFEIRTFKGETILAPRSECYCWSCPNNPGCFCGACHP